MSTTETAVRHLLAALAYRFRASVREMPQSFAGFELGDGVRTPREIVRHMTHVLRYARRAVAPYEVTEPEPRDWPGEVRRFHDTLIELDSVLAGDAADPAGLNTILQGPIADALTHVGQLNLLRRKAGLACPRESFMRADVRMGDLGPNG